MSSKSKQIKRYIETIRYIPSSSDLGDRFDCSPRNARRAINKYGLREIYPSESEYHGNKDSQPPPNRTFNNKGDEATLTYNKIDTDKTDEQIVKETIEECNIDDDVWYVDEYTVIKNQWDMSYKGKGKTKGVKWTDKEGKEHTKTNTNWDSKTTTNYQYKIRIKFKRNEELTIIKKTMEKCVGEMKEHAPEYPPIIYKEVDDSCLAVVNLVDTHAGKLCVEEETGNSVTLESAINTRNWAIDKVEGILKKKKIHRICYVVGNDDTHVDNLSGTTTYGTHLDSDSKSFQQYQAIRKSHIRAIDKFMNISPVYVVSMPGNHDGNLGYYMGDTLDSWYRKCDNVTVDSEPRPQKYFLDGVTMFMITHGRHEKRKNLSNIMSTDEPEMWGKAKCREILTGDKHHKKDINYIGTEDMQGVIVRTLPTLSGLDRWHKERGYRSKRSADIFYYKKETGLSGTDHISLLEYIKEVEGK